MPRIASMATQKLMAILAADEGVPAKVTSLALELGVTLPAVTAHQIVAQNVAPEISERHATSKYPLLYVYCSKVVNELREKFRTFSGDVEMVVETRVSQDRIDDIEAQLQLYVDAVTSVLNENRGDWDDGVTYSGGYEIAFGGVKHGGRNLIQIAKISFVLEISAD
jgi:hypothetical protein